MKGIKIQIFKLRKKSERVSQKKFQKNFRFFLTTLREGFNKKNLPAQEQLIRYLGG